MCPYTHAHTYKRLLEELVFGIILPEVQTAVWVHSPAWLNLHNQLMVFYDSLWKSQTRVSLVHAYEFMNHARAPKHNMCIKEHKVKWVTDLLT